MDAARWHPDRRVADGQRAGVARVSPIPGRWPVDPTMRTLMMPRALLALLMLVALPLWAAEPKELTWSEMIPPDAAPEVPNMTPLHDLSQMSSALESAPAARQDRS